MKATWILHSCAVIPTDLPCGVSFTGFDFIKASVAIYKQWRRFVASERLVYLCFGSHRLALGK